MKFQDYSLPLIAITGVLALLVASPALSRLLVYPRTDFFTELAILGPNHMAEDYPFNISSGNNYDVFLEIKNKLGYCAYYLVEAKFRNQSQPAPDSFNFTSSSLPSLFNFTAIVEDEGSWELPLTFAINYEYENNMTLVRVSSLTLNDLTLNIVNCTVTWNSYMQGFYSNLFFELWIYNQTTATFQYHERFLSLWFNMTAY
ncbi:DUF1616 domain-containing protein [Candidatus Bathyarchaeota archaeon]|nr:DUF1616 domain-containing protein [Candidatus Bathyarchaeota archaeon]